MTDDTNEPPIFPTNAPEVFCDSDATPTLFDEVLSRLADVVDVDDTQLGLPTPCAGFDVAALRTHVLGWLQFFAAALSDPTGDADRPDPEAFALPPGTTGSDIVGKALADIKAAIAADVAGRLVTMSSSRMAGDGVLGMALGEYIVHAWDLARATGAPYAAPDSAVLPAHEFLQGMVAPEYRGPDSGFFDDEVEVAADASPLDRLLGFAGRDPHWQP
ncbi:MAG: TIGR03086 family metal-binding protein [Acidimicrobiales bacterium]